MIFKNILLAFQLENYKNIRFLRFIYSHPKFWIQGSKRQTLEYTSKAKLIFVLAVLLCIGYIVWSVYLFSWIILWLNLWLIVLLLPVYFVISNILILPLDLYLKRKIIQKAKQKISTYKDLKVIAITGSYGKTTTKEILWTILSESFQVLTTQGTKNTALGISQLILDQLNTSHEVFIVEMWAYIKWDITELCEIVWPNISIITGITLQHLERFKNLDNIIDAKFEILEYLQKDDFAVVDISTQWVQKWLKEKQLKVTNIVKIQKGAPYSYKENLSWMSFEIQGNNIETRLLSNYIGETLQICYEVWKYLWQSMDDFKLWVKKIDFVEHRMQLIYNPQSNVFVIDDSFNGNLEGIASILDLMRSTPFTWRKILVAWWVVELWDETEKVHLQLWKQMAEVSDMILLVEWPVWNAIKKWLQESWFSQNKIKIYTSPLMLHADLTNIIQSGDMVVFQNDLPDNYL